MQFKHTTLCTYGKKWNDCLRSSLIVNVPIKDSRFVRSKNYSLRRELAIHQPSFTSWGVCEVFSDDVCHWTIPPQTREGKDLI